MTRPFFEPRKIDERKLVIHFAKESASSFRWAFEALSLCLRILAKMIAKRLFGNSHDLPPAEQSACESPSVIPNVELRGARDDA